MDKNMEQNQNLFAAAYEGNVEGFKAALAGGADIDYISKNVGFTTLGRAAYCDHFDAVKYLLEVGANPFMPYSNRDKTPQILAQEAGYQQIADYISTMMKSADIINRRDKDGDTPLTHCMKANFWDRVEELIDLGADVNKPDSEDKTPIVLTIDYCHRCHMKNIIKKLLYHGASPFAYSALTYSLDSHQSEAAGAIIESNKALVDCVLSDGFTPLTKALFLKNITIARYLLVNGADAAKIDNHKNAPLDLALPLNYLEIIELIVSKGVRIPKELDQQVLNAIVKQGTVKFYTFLVKNGWNIDQLTEDGKTLLAHYASQKDLTLIRFFLLNGANKWKAAAELENLRKGSPDFDFFMRTHDCIKKEPSIKGDGGHE